MSRKQKEKAVDDGKVNYFSASSLSTGDPEQIGGCLRRYFYKYVAGFKEPFTAQQQIGVQTHKCIENYLKSGERTLNRLAMSAGHLIPRPDKSLMIEPAIKEGDLQVEGVPVVGYIDLLNNSGSFIDIDGEEKEMRDCVEVIDWKTTANISKYAKSGQDLIKTIQMPLYAKWGTNITSKKNARISHVYMQTKGRSKSVKASAFLDEEELSKRWEEIEAVARSLKDVAKETKAENVPGNRHACMAYRGCPHSNYCPRTTEDLLFTIFGIGDKNGK